MIVYKIVLEENGDLKTLFKAIEGRRILPLNKWLKAENKMGIDGSGQTPYLTGIHCFKNKFIALRYLDNFRTKKHRVLVECLAEGVRVKPSNPNVFLVDRLKILNVIR